MRGIDVKSSKVNRDEISKIKGIFSIEKVLELKGSTVSKLIRNISVPKMFLLERWFEETQCYKS